MQEPFVLQMPVKPHVKKFIEANVTLPLELKLDNSFGIIIYLLTRRQHTHYRYDEFVKNYSERIDIIVPGRVVFDRGVKSISSKAIVMFNTLINDIFMDSMMDHIALQNTLMGMTEHSSILYFVNIYGITENDISVDTLKKRLYRVRLEQQNGTRRKHPFFWKHGNRDPINERDFCLPNKKRA